MPRGKQSGIRYGQKKQEGQSDTAQLIAIKRHLKDKHKILAKREPYLLFKNGKLLSVLDHVKRSQVHESIEIKNPDLLWINKYGMWILEVDGKVHHRKYEKTLKRNNLFITNKINLIVIKLYEMDKNQNIYKYIDEEILRIIRNK